MIKVCLCGAGSLGSQIAMMIARPDLVFLVIDDERIEAENIATSTSAYYRHHVGALKARVLAEMLYRKCGASSQVHIKTLTDGSVFSVLLLFGPDLIIDTFDNSGARELTTCTEVPTVHVGVSESRTGSVTWDEHYTVPDGPPRGENPICTHELGRGILRFTSAVAAGVIDRFLVTGEKVDCVVTESLEILK